VKDWAKIITFTLYMKKAHITNEQSYTISALVAQGLYPKLHYVVEFIQFFFTKYFAVTKKSSTFAAIFV
jgi:hypothetical protein